MASEAQRILNQRCVICHSCYDAPCQLKLSSLDGLLRGASKEPVYNPSRLDAIPPTRLFIDAQSTEEWRALGFHSVLNTKLRAPSTLEALLQLKAEKPLASGKKIPPELSLDIERELSCPNHDELQDYKNQNPMGGMPYAMPQLPPAEYQLLLSWLQSAPLTLPGRPELSETEKHEIQKWESFLNQPSKKSKLVSRYLYEHLFLAHIVFDNIETTSFFRLVRSSSPAGYPIKELTTVHPNDSPGNKRWYYRMRLVTSTAIDKTHIIYRLNDKKLRRITELFMADDWEIDTLPDYSDNNSNNPFVTFAAIPSAQRYRFLLENSDFFIENFIKGPVCRGQVALNVINDYFFVAFLSPDFDLSVVDDTYLNNAKQLLTLPEKSADYTDFASVWHQRLHAYRQYLQYRDRAYSSHPLTREGFPIEAIWSGTQDSRGELPTVFRHFDSATVMEGFVGGTPKTAWLIDYPILERIYYDLVVNFNVFGNSSHQILTRVYMDYLRMESETLWVSLLPITK